MVRVLLFGRLADAAGWRERDIAHAGLLSDLRASLAAETPDLAGAEVLCAVNRVLVRDDPAISEGDEVAFMPPFSGG